MRQKNEQGGELIVVGSGKVKVNLRDYPHKTNVLFKKKCTPPPCNPHHHHHTDQLRWEIKRSHHGHGLKYTLTIEWEVSEVREIIWLVYY